MKYFFNKRVIFFAVMDATSGQLHVNQFCSTPKISPVICGAVVGGRGLVCHSQSSVTADWRASRWAGLYWMGM